MKAMKNAFAVGSTSGKTLIGRSVIVQPKTNFKGGSIKWFDDTRLIRKPISISR